MRIYTRTGDEGVTSLYKGIRRYQKSDPIFDCLGDLDELNSHLGLLLFNISLDKELNTTLKDVQQDILDISSIIAGAPLESSLENRLKEQVEVFEDHIDGISETVPNLTSFILPGETKEEAQTHVVRAVCRRTERKVVGIVDLVDCDMSIVLSYINRLSDLLFMISLSKSCYNG